MLLINMQLHLLTTTQTCPLRRLILKTSSLLQKKRKSRIKTEGYNFPTERKSRNAVRVRRLFLVDNFKTEEGEVLDADEYVSCEFCGINWDQYPISVD
jgi:hypothetical protein